MTPFKNLTFSIWASVRLRSANQALRQSYLDHKQNLLDQLAVLKATRQYLHRSLSPAPSLLHEAQQAQLDFHNPVKRELPQWEALEVCIAVEIARDWITCR